VWKSYLVINWLIEWNDTIVVADTHLQNRKMNTWHEIIIWQVHTNFFTRNLEHIRARLGDKLQWTLKVPARGHMINQIDKECRTLTVIETASKFPVLDHVVWLNHSESGLTVLEDINIWKIRKKWGAGRLHRIFLSLHDISIAIILDHHDSLENKSRFDAYSRRYLCKLKVSNFWLESHFMQNRNFMDYSGRKKGVTTGKKGRHW
jgi:hypothetical protein